MSWTTSEKTVLKKLSNPAKIQAFLDGLPYSSDSFTRSPREVLRDRTAHCFDGAIFSAAALRFIGYPPLLMDLRAVNDDDHILAIFRKSGFWGAIAKSNFSGLRFREPIFRNLRELALSYFEDYYNLNARKTLREYSVPLDLRKFDKINWMFGVGTGRDLSLQKIAYKLDEIRHYYLVTPKMIRGLSKVDKRSFKAGTLGLNMAGVYKPKN